MTGIIYWFIGVFARSLLFAILAGLAGPWIAKVAIKRKFKIDHRYSFGQVFLPYLGYSCLGAAALSILVAVGFPINQEVGNGLGFLWTIVMGWIFGKRYKLPNGDPVGLYVGLNLALAPMILGMVLWLVVVGVA